MDLELPSRIKAYETGRLCGGLWRGEEEGRGGGEMWEGGGVGGGVLVWIRGRYAAEMVYWGDELFGIGDQGTGSVNRL